jgi:hypothetical protein
LTQDPFHDAFTHLPNLRARVTHPEKSRLRLTPEAFAALDERARLAGQPANWRLSDQVLEDSSASCSAIAPSPAISGSIPMDR